MPFSAFLFDYNGVIVDDERVHLAAYQDALRPLGVTMTEESYWERYLGFDDWGAFRAVLADQGRPADDHSVNALVEAKRPHYLRRARQELRACDGASELLRELSARAVIGIVSGALRDEIELGLELLGVKDTVRFIVAAEDAPRCKPDPMGYLLGRQRLTQHLDAGRLTSPGATLVLEDSIAGIESAHAAGLPCLGVAHTYPIEELRAANVAAAVSRLTELDLPFLDRLSARLGAP